MCFFLSFVLSLLIKLDRHKMFLKGLVDGLTTGQIKIKTDKAQLSWAWQWHELGKHASQPSLLNLSQDSSLKSFSLKIIPETSKNLNDLTIDYAHDACLSINNSLKNRRLPCLKYISRKENSTLNDNNHHYYHAVCAKPRDMKGMFSVESESLFDLLHIVFEILHQVQVNSTLGLIWEDGA